AEAAYANIAVEVVNQAISALESVDDLTGKTEDELKTLLSAYEDVTVLYEALTDEQKTQVTGYDEVTSGIEKINEQLNLVVFETLLDAVTDVDNVTKDGAAAVIAAYNALTEMQQSGLSTEQISKYEKILEAYKEFNSGNIVIIFANPESNSGAENLAADNPNVNVANEKYTGTGEFDYDGVTYTGALYLDDGDSVTIKLEAGKSYKITICVDSGKKVNYWVNDDKSSGVTADSDGIITQTISADDNAESFSISKNNKTYLYYVIIEEID
ncbi:MAG: hypothetical protein LUD47_00845, partial [Clostridia bacterium]|nr:hypothetical protein [Clostridia bacterium]